MKIKPNGTEVLIFNYIREWGPNQDEENYIIGTIQSSKISDDLSYQGNPWYEQIYEVLGQDNKIYRGCYERGIIGNYFFRTKEDHINILKRRIKRNEEEILKIQEKNKEYERQISKISEQKTDLEQCKHKTLKKVKI